MSSLNDIKEKMSCLPQKDIKYATKFIDNRDFDSLLELIDSDIKKILIKSSKRGFQTNAELAEEIKLSDYFGTVIEYLNSNGIPYDFVPEEDDDSEDNVPTEGNYLDIYEEID